MGFCRLFDKDVKCANPERIATARARFLKQSRNLVLGGERYRYSGDAADAINELITKAHSALEIPLGCLKPTLTGRAAKLPQRLFWAPSTAESCRT